MPGSYVPLALVFGDIFTEARAAYFETQYALAKERERFLGGIPEVGESSDVYVDVPGVVIVLLDHDASVQIHAMGFVSTSSPPPSPPTTGLFQLYDITAAAAVAGSEVSFDDTVPTLQVGSTLELLEAHAYKLQVKVSDPLEHVLVWGAKLVTQ